MRKGILIPLLLLLSGSAMAQQEPAFSQYFFNLLNINPAYAGTRDYFSGTLITRNQWVGMDGGPTTQSLGVHMALPKTNTGLGLQIYHDVAGPIKTTGLSATYAYRILVNPNTHISFGITGSLAGLSLSGSEIHINNQYDKAFSTNNSSAMVPDADFGVYLYKSNLFLGASMTHLLQSNFRINDAAGNHSAKYYRNYYFTAAYVKAISDAVSFRPTAQFKYVASAPLVGELDGCFIFHDKFFAGLGLRSSKRINITGTDNILVGILELEFLRDYRIGYSYDYYLNQNSIYNGGTHEIMLGWDVSRHLTRLENPRYF